MTSRIVNCKPTLFIPPASLRLLLLVTLTAALTGCDGGSDPVELAEGQEPYLRYCASCHGNQGQGKAPAFPPLAGSEWMELPSEALAVIVLYGLRGEIEVAGQTYRGYMPPMQHLTDEDVAGLLGFAERSWANREPVLTSSDIAALRTALPDQRGPLEGLDGVMQALDRLP
jgi:mono/diheme cytochrome c family protein